MPSLKKSRINYHAPCLIHFRYHPPPHLICLERILIWRRYWKNKWLLLLVNNILLLVMVLRCSTMYTYIFVWWWEDKSVICWSRRKKRWSWWWSSLVVRRTRATWFWRWNKQRKIFSHRQVTRPTENNHVIITDRHYFLLWCTSVPFIKNVYVCKQSVVNNMT